jgi:hypothetical protein
VSVFLHVTYFILMCRKWQKYDALRRQDQAVARPISILEISGSNTVHVISYPHLPDCLHIKTTICFVKGYTPFSVVNKSIIQELSLCS